MVNDAYNANPESMRAALAALAGLAGSRRIAVLGGMAELGPDAAAEHERLGRDAAAAVDRPDRRGRSRCGRHSRRGGGRRSSCGEESVHVPDRAARELLAEVLRPGDVVLVKASRSYGLELLAADLLTPTGLTREGGPDRRRPRPDPLDPADPRGDPRVPPAQGLGQEIRDDGPETHLSKQGTPTMGGTVIVGATVVGYVAPHVTSRPARLGASPPPACCCCS